MVITWNYWCVTFCIIAIGRRHSCRCRRERHLFRAEGHRFTGTGSRLGRGSEPSLDKTRSRRRATGQARCRCDRRLHRTHRWSETELGRRRKSGSEIEARFLFGRSVFGLPNFAAFLWRWIGCEQIWWMLISVTNLQCVIMSSTSKVREVFKFKIVS